MDDRTTIATITAAIARSEIVSSFSPDRLLPDGFDEVDVAILEWIAAETRRARVTLLRPH